MLKLYRFFVEKHHGNFHFYDERLCSKSKLNDHHKYWVIGKEISFFLVKMKNDYLIVYKIFFELCILHL